MNKDIYLFESSVLPISVAYLGNTDKSTLDNDVIDFEDVNLSYENFIYLFFDNNYHFFHVNEQFSKHEDLLIDNKIIKNMKAKSTNKLFLIDLITNKFIKNKKLKLNENLRLNLIKDMNNYNTIFDFKIHNKFLNLDDVIMIYNHQFNKNKKSLFRFKIFTNYYSEDLDESLTMSFNYLVEIPKNFDIQNYEVNVPKKIVEKVAVAPEENIVYSNYNSNNKAVYDDLEKECNDDSENESLSAVSSEDFF